MAKYFIDDKSIGYSYAGNGEKCKIYFNVYFIASSRIKSKLQYYECDWDSNLTEEENMCCVYEQLQDAANSFSLRV